MRSMILHKELLKIAAVLFIGVRLISACAKPSPEAKIPPTLTPTAAHMPTPSPTPTPTLTLVPTASPTPKPTATPTPYVDRTPPEISGLEWQPTRVVNSKVYDGRVTFEAQDEGSPIAYAELNFVPKEYPHLSRAAFPEEGPRKLVLKPLDGAFDELKEEFAAKITDIVGGREYEVVAVVRNKAGDMGTASLGTPYIREFENIAPLDDILVGAFYYPWYNKHDPWFRFWFDEAEWESLGYEARPLLGQYRSDDPVLISKHIDWATGHGIDYFLVSWGYAGGPGGFNDNVLKNLILENPLIDQIKFCVLYESGGRLTSEESEFDLTDPHNRQQLAGDFNYPKC